MQYICKIAKYNIYMFLNATIQDFRNHIVIFQIQKHS